MKLRLSAVIKTNRFLKRLFLFTLLGAILVSQQVVVEQASAQSTLANTAQEVKVEAFSPTVSDNAINRTSVRFTANVAAIGETNVTPIAIVCDGQPVTLVRGRWTSPREWQASFNTTLPAQTRCEASVSLPATINFKPRKFNFSGGPIAITRIWPSFGERIDENQHFVLQTNTPLTIDPATALKNSQAYCSSSKFGEKINLEQVSPDTAKKIIATLGNQISKETDTSRLLVLKCARPLGEDAAVNLVWGRTFNFATHPAFRATVNCEREQSGQPCIPVRPITIRFATPISVADAKKISIKSSKGNTIKASVSTRDDQEISSVDFLPPFEPSSQYAVNFGTPIQDVLGRKMDQAAIANLKITTGQAPPLAKFAASFGIIERQVGALPVTIRNVGQANQFSIRSEMSMDDVQVVRWLRMADYEDRNESTSRLVPIVSKNKNAKLFDVAAWPKTQELQVVGIPLTEPGFHQVEIESGVLGQAILEKNTDGSDRKMYVRSYALVTSMAVHMKLSRENAVVWVTSLETGKVVANAKINVLDCTGKLVWSGSSDQFGLAKIDQPLSRPTASACATAAKKFTAGFVDPNVKAAANSRDERSGDFDDEPAESSWFVATARKDNDFSFVSSTWVGGIEPWRFNVNTSFNNSADDSLLGHTIFARDLLRQGETVHMKHLFRRAAASGLIKPGPELSKRISTVEIIHQGSDQTFEVPIKWLSHDPKSGTAISEWTIPQQANLGLYNVRAKANKPTAANPRDNAGDEQAFHNLDLGSFQVAEFRLPTVRGNIQTKGDDVSVQMSFLNGGAAGGLSTTVSALTSRYSPNFSQYPEFTFYSVAQGLGLQAELLRPRP
jgi:hypothetical protein